MGGGKVLPNVPKDLVIVGSEKGGIKRKPEDGKFELFKYKCLTWLAKQSQKDARKIKRYCRKHCKW